MRAKTSRTEVFYARVSPEVKEVLSKCLKGALSGEGVSGGGVEGEKPVKVKEEAKDADVAVLLEDVERLTAMVKELEEKVEYWKFADADDKMAYWRGRAMEAEKRVKALEDAQ